MRYKIVMGYLKPTGKSVDNIEELIQINLDDGFTLYGDLIHLESNKFCQVMIYTRDKK